MKKHLLQEEWEKIILHSEAHMDWWNRKKEDFKKREIKILQINGEGQAFQRLQTDNEEEEFTYLLHLNFLLKQRGKIFLEEMVIPCTCKLQLDSISFHQISDQIKMESSFEEGEYKPDLESDMRSNERAFVYDRRKAVQYAERWWNEYNPAYQKFENDCTNFISQCLRAGGAPLWGSPNRSRGWWYSGTNWSYSWSVANALRWYLSSSTKGLTAKEVSRASDLMLGDVICYDFEGDGRWNHNTIVVAKDANGEPLVNAHTYNSRHRYWKYEDSTAWTPNIQYKFFRIGG